MVWCCGVGGTYISLGDAFFWLATLNNSLKFNIILDFADPGDDIMLNLGEAGGARRYRGGWLS